MYRRLEYKDSLSHKFWEVTITGSSLTVRYGRIGATGQVHTTECGSPDKANKKALSKLKSKKNKGYKEVKVEASSRAPIAVSKKKAVTTARKQLTKALGYLKKHNIFINQSRLRESELSKLPIDADTSDGSGLYHDAVIAWPGETVAGAYDKSGCQIAAVTMPWRGDKAALQIAFARAQLALSVPLSNEETCELKVENPETHLKALMRAFDALKRKRIPAYGNMALTQSGGWEDIRGQCDLMGMRQARGIFWTNQGHNFNDIGNIPAGERLLLYWLGKLDVFCSALELEGLKVTRPANEDSAIEITH
jgi:predicted DNA-binding WGR domain protein